MCCCTQLASNAFEKVAQSLIHSSSTSLLSGQLIASFIFAEFCCWPLLKRPRSRSILLRHSRILGLADHLETDHRYSTPPCATSKSTCVSNLRSSQFSLVAVFAGCTLSAKARGRNAVCALQYLQLGPLDTIFLGRLIDHIPIDFRKWPDEFIPPAKSDTFSYPVCNIVVSETSEDSLQVIPSDRVFNSALAFGFGTYLIHCPIHIIIDSLQQHSNEDKFSQFSTTDI